MVALKRGVRAFGAIVLLGFVLACSASAQTLRVGGDGISGELKEGDAQGQGGQFQDVYTLRARAGQVLRINLDSTAVDTLLRVTGPNGFVAEDDDSGDLLNAQLDLNVPANGTYQVIATTYNAGAAGAYTLRVTELDPRSMAATAAATGTLTLNQSVNGALAQGDPTRSSGQFADTYTFQGQVGQTVDIRLNAPGYDPLLSITGPGGFQAENDDDTDSAAPLQNSRLVVTLPQAGAYRIQASSYSSGATGNYTLSIAPGSANAAQAQGSASTQGVPLTLGQPMQGALQQGDGQLNSGEFADAYRFLGQAGQHVTIDMTSSAFDTYIILRKPDGTQVDNDDLAQGNTNSRVDLTLETTGEYLVYATTYQPGESGAYQLVVNAAGATAVAAASLPSISGAAALTANRPVSGALARGDHAAQDGHLFDAYSFEGRRGQNVSIDLTSSVFDTYLRLVSPSGRTVENDDGIPGTLNSRINESLTEDGRYTVLVSSYDPGASGAYTLSMGAGTAAPSGSNAPLATSGQRVFLLSVGISDYSGYANNLDYTADDARNLFNALRANGTLAQGSAVLTDGQATVANVRAAFQRIAAQVGPNDLFIFFFSGHGSQANARGGGELDGRDEYIVLRDGMISDDEMGRMFQTVHGRLSLIALDSCFSGGFARDVITSPHIMGLFSSDEDLTSAVADKFQAGGYLSHFLRTAFQGEADENHDREITAGELHSYMWRRFASEQSIGAESMDGAQNYQRIVVDRGGVKIDDVVIDLRHT